MLSISEVAEVVLEVVMLIADVVVVVVVVLLFEWASGSEVQKLKEEDVG